MHLTLFEDAHFDGTYIDFDTVIADGAGLIPQTGKVITTDFTIALYDSANNADAATIAATEITGTGTYRIRTTYADINRAAGDGIWKWVFTRVNPDLTFMPHEVSVTLNQLIGTIVSDAGNTATTFKTDRTETTNNFCAGRFVRFVNGNLAEQIKKITTYDGTTKFITVQSAYTATPNNGIMFEIF